MTFNFWNRALRKIKWVFHTNFYSFYKGDKYHCNICDTSFKAMVDLNDKYSIRGKMIDHYTPNAICPRCGSFMRHRMMFEYINTHHLFDGNNSLLHFAPEPYLVKKVLQYPQVQYTTCDIQIKNTPNFKQIDITRIDFPDNNFDLIICSHVLEHIEEDQKAISELFRVLKPGGIALLELPTYGNVTEEDLSLDAAGREKEYGINIHVRLNGLDVVDKFKTAGFNVTVESIDTIPGNYFDRTHYSAFIDSDKYLFVCSKP